MMIPKLSLMLSQMTLKMLSNPLRNSLYSFLFVCTLCSNTVSAFAQSDPCNTTDPLGANTGNLCPSHPSGLTSDSFHNGIGRPYQSLPTVQNPAGAILIQPKGFWTEMKTSGSSRVIRESSGKSYQLSK